MSKNKLIGLFTCTFLVLFTCHGTTSTIQDHKDPNTPVQESITQLIDTTCNLFAAGYSIDNIIATLNKDQVYFFNVQELVTKIYDLLALSHSKKDVLNIIITNKEFSEFLAEKNRQYDRSSLLKTLALIGLCISVLCVLTHCLKQESPSINNQKCSFGNPDEHRLAENVPLHVEQNKPPADTEKTLNQNRCNNQDFDAEEVDPNALPNHAIQNINPQFDRALDEAIAHQINWAQRIGLQVIER